MQQIAALRKQLEDKVSIPVDKVRASLLRASVILSGILVSIPVDKVRARLPSGSRQRHRVSIPVDKVRAPRGTKDSSSSKEVSIPVDKVRADNYVSLALASVCFNPRG